MKNTIINIDQQQLEMVQDILKRYIPECEVRLFGSRLTDKVKKYSDIDLAVVGDEKIERSTWIQLKEAFEDSILPVRVDLLDWHSISNAFKQVIEKEYAVIQERRRS